MTASYDSQFEQLTTEETAANDPLSVPFLRVAELNYNNLIGRVANYPIVMDANPANPSVETQLVSSDHDTRQNVIAPLGRHWVPRNFAWMSYQAISLVCSGTPPSDYTEWTVSVSGNLYVGPTEFNSSKLTFYSSATFRSDSTSWNRQTGYIEIPSRNANGYIYATLVAQNSTTAARSTIASITLQPIML